MELRNVYGISGVEPDTTFYYFPYTEDIIPPEITGVIVLPSKRGCYQFSEEISSAPAVSCQLYFALSSKRSQ